LHSSWAYLFTTCTDIHNLHLFEKKTSMSNNRDSQMPLTKVVQIMKQPTLLLKFGMSGSPKFTNLQLELVYGTADQFQISWVSAKKDASQARGIIISSVHVFLSLFWLLNFHCLNLSSFWLSLSTVLMKNVTELRWGQRTEKFKRNLRPDLQHLSFSLCYSTSTNLSCAKVCSRMTIIWICSIN
jgi:hypothetical protein